MGERGGSAGAKARDLAARAAGLRAEADRLETQAGRWSAGEAGERRSGETLDRFGKGTGAVVLHDRLVREGSQPNLDHVLVGPFGTVVVDAKNWSGSVSVALGVVSSNGHRQDKTLAVAGDAAAMARKATGGRAYAVICLVGEARVGGPVDVDGVTVLDLPDLEGWLRALPVAADRSGQSSAALKVWDLFPPQTGTNPGRRPCAGRRGLPGWRGRRTRKVLAWIAVAWVVLALVALVVAGGAPGRTTGHASGLSVGSPVAGG